MIAWHFILGYLLGVAICWWLKERHIKRLETTLAMASLELRSCERWAESERRIAIQQRVRAEKLEKARAAILKNIRGSSYKMRAAR